MFPYPLPPNEPSNGSNNHVVFICEDRSRHLWITTYGGINLYHPAIDSFTYFPSLYQVYSIYQSQDYTYWTGTMNGLARFDENTGAFYFQKQINKMPLVATSIQEDMQGWLWFSAPDGLYKVHPSTQQLFRFNKKDGLLNNQFFNSSLKSNTGEMYFASTTGFTRFRPEKIKQNTFIPALILSNFQLFNKDLPIADTAGDTLEWNSPLQKNIAYTKKLTLLHWQNDFAIEFAALDFTAPENNRYQFRLLGYNNQWIAANAQERTAYYTNLDPGKYAFQVKGSNNDGVWNEEGTVMNIDILPPWWATWWAYLLYFLTTGGLLWSVRNYELKRKLAKAEAQRLQELNAVKTKLYTNITHEFRTPLTIILGMADQLAVGSKQLAVGSIQSFGSKLENGLKMVKHNANQLLRLVNQMLDLSKLEAGHLQLNLQQGDIISYLAYLTESFHSYAAGKDIDLNFKSDMETFRMDYDSERLRNVVSNLLSNAIKFTPEGREVYIHLLAGEEDLTSQQKSGKNLSNLKLIVSDTGIGISLEKLPNIFDRFYQVDDSHTRKGEGTGIGLTLTKELVKLMGGEITVKSEVGKGTEFIVTLPITRKAEKQVIQAPAGDKKGMKESGFLKESNALAAMISENEDTEKLLTVKEQCVFFKFKFKCQIQVQNATSSYLFE